MTPVRSPGRGPLPASQARSRDTLERLVDAAAAVIGERGLHGASVAAITERAGTSVGNFYRRFPDKEALIEHLERRVLAGRAEFWDRELVVDRWKGRTIADLLGLVVAEIVGGHARNRALLRAIALHARSEYEIRVTELGVNLPGRIHDLIHGLWPGFVRHPDPRLAIRLGFEMVAATAGEILLFRSLPEPVDPGTLVCELTRAWLAYLDVADPRRASSPV